MDVSLDTKFGRVILREWSEYVEGESMGSTSRRTGAGFVVLLAPGVSAHEVTAGMIEDNMGHMFKSRQNA